MFGTVFFLWTLAAACYPLVLGQQSLCTHRSPSYDLKCDSESDDKPLKCYGDEHVVLNFCEYQMSQNFSAPGVPSTSWDFPGPPVDFMADIVYYQYYFGECLPVLNISWKLGIDASIKYLKGYHLKVVDLMGKNTEERVFLLKLNSEDLTPDQLKSITMYYPCFSAGADRGHDFQITLQSLPASSSNSVKESVAVADLVNRTRETDPEKSYFWEPPGSSVKVRGSTVVYSFQPAPAEFNFTSYEVDLSVPHSEEPSYISVVNRTGFDLQHVTFHNVSPGIYFIKIRPVAVHECTCRIGPECRERCRLTVVIRIVVESEVPVITPEPSGTSSTLSFVFLGLLVSIVAVFGAVLSLMLCLRKDVCYILYESNPRHQHHEVVVTKFSQFVYRHSSINVRLMNSFDATEAELLSLVETLETGKNVIAVHSEKRGPLDDDPCGDNMFDKLLMLFQQNQLNMSKKRRLFHVSFNYTSPEFVRGVRIGRKFRLMQDVLGLVVELGGNPASTCFGWACAGCRESSELMNAYVDAGGMHMYVFETGIVPPQVDAASMCTLEIEENLNDVVERDAVDQRLQLVNGGSVVEQSRCACISRLILDYLSQLPLSTSTVARRANLDAD